MRERKWLPLIILCCLAVAPTNVGQTRKASHPEKPADLEAKVDAYVKPFVEAKTYSGAVLIARKGKVVFRKAYGMANYELDVANTQQTKFHIASVSKPFTASAIMILEERELLSVRDPLSKFIPDYPNGDKITIHHLLTHTSGIPNVNNFPQYNDWSRFPQTPASNIEKFKDKPLAFQPGARYDYSNSNYNLLAFIIEKASGKSYGAFLKESIFDPLGMSDTAHDGAPQAVVKNMAAGYAPLGFSDLEESPYLDWTIKTGNGSLYSTVDDLYKWDRALYSEKLLKRATLERIFTPHMPNVGYGWFISRRLNRNCIRINGRSPGFQCELQRYVDDDVCVIVLGNNYSGAASFMIDSIAAIAFGEPYEPLALNPGLKISPNLTDSYLGRYEGGADFFVPRATMIIEKRDNGLTIRWSMGGLSYLVPMTDAKFFDRTFGGVLTFVKNDRGEISEAIYRSGGTDYRASRARTN